MALHSYDIVKSVLESVGLLESLCNFQREELDDSVLDEITIEDLSQAGLNEQQGIAFIGKHREYLNRKIDAAPPEHVVTQIATVSEHSGSSSVSNSAAAGTSDAHLSSTDARVVWRWQSDDGTKFNDYDDTISSRLEHAFNLGKPMFVITEKNWAFDFVAMTQTNTSSASKRAIQRFQLGGPSVADKQSSSIVPAPPSHPRFGRPAQVFDSRAITTSSPDSIHDAIGLANSQFDPDAILPPSSNRQSLPLPPKKAPPPLPPPRRGSVDAPAGQMSISVKFSVVYDAEIAVCIGSDASEIAKKMRAVVLVQGHNLHLDAILCLCQPSPDTREHCTRKGQCVNLGSSTITPLVKGTRTDGTNIINRFEAPADAMNQTPPEESVDKFSRQEIFACFEEMKSLEEFVDAVKRSCASASQLLNYIDSLPLAPKRDKGSLGGKGFSLFRGIADIAPPFEHSPGTTMLATGGAAVTKIIGSAPTAEASRDDLNLSGEAFRVIVEVLKSALHDRKGSSVLATQLAIKEDVLEYLPAWRRDFEKLREEYGLQDDGCSFFRNPARLSWFQIVPLTLILPLEPVQCSKLRALKLPKSLIRDSLAKMACGFFDGVFVDSRPLSASNAELNKMELCNGGLGSHQLEPLKSTWHMGSSMDAVSFLCTPLSFVDLCSLATGGELPEDCQPGWLNWNVCYGQCIGTCYREFTSLSQSRQLFNAYMCALQDHNGAPRVIMRHAVPNSSDRIKMIGAALKSCKFPIKRVRMLSLLTRHGFNEEESVFGDHHSDWQQTEFASISMQANANTKFNWANQGETHNAVCNSLAWLRYGAWILKDLCTWAESFGDFDHIFDGRRVMLIFETKKLEELTRRGISSCESPAQNVNEMRTRTLKPIAVALYTALDAATGSSLDLFRERVAKFESICQAMRIFHRLVSSQYPSGREGEVLPRTSELALLAALDRMLGVSSLMNCKSGCDRAGLAHGITMAVESLYCSHPSSVATATLLDLESLFAEIDDKVVRTTDYSGVLQEIMRESIKFDLGISSQSGAKRTPATNGQGIVADAGHNQLFLPLTPEKAATVALGLNVRAPNQHSPQFVIAHLTQNHQPPNRYQLMCLCCELRNMFLKHVMCIGWKVNIHSCGVPGLKYNIKVAASSGSSISGKIKSVGKDISTNPHFGVFLPPVAFVGDPMQSPVAIRLQVNQVVTEEFGAFINGCSSFRGS